MQFRARISSLQCICAVLVDRERIAKAKSIFDKRALELLNRAKLKKSKLKQKGAALPLPGHANKPDSSQVEMTIFLCSLYLFHDMILY